MRKTIAIVVPPLTGHINPMVPVSMELKARGHRPVWILHPGPVAHLLPEESEVIPLPEPYDKSYEDELKRKADSTRGLAAFQFLWEDFLIPLADGMMDDVNHALKELKPDLVIADQQALAGGMVATQLGIPWITSSTTSASLVDPFSMVPSVQEWMLEQFEKLQIRWGLEPVTRPDWSPLKIIAFSTRRFVGEDVQVPEQTVFVGPSVRTRPEPEGFPFERIEGKAPLLVSVGTLNQARSKRFFEVVAEAFADWDRPVIAIAPPDLLERWPEHFIVQPRIPQLSILPHCSAVVTHAGHNTVVESLLQGLPLVLAPIRDDQPVIAGQVVDAGAGLRVHFSRVGPRKLREAVTRVIDESPFREAAIQLRDDFLSSGGTAAAADEVETCL